ncbi:hypothetical protein LCGC14_1903220 [marine sediment metagenome]|uniref:Uncharacterized protein n=1 Tax=marine sediment metagenome TaxID=412755 RepID=A0A0F9FW88_9ZZZZ
MKYELEALLYCPKCKFQKWWAFGMKDEFESKVDQECPNPECDCKKLEVKERKKITMNDKSLVTSKVNYNVITG